MKLTEALTVRAAMLAGEADLLDAMGSQETEIIPGPGAYARNLNTLRLVADELTGLSALLEQPGADGCRFCSDGPCNGLCSTTGSGKAP